MAATAAGTVLTQAYRRQQLAIRARTLRDLTTLWPGLSMTALDRTWPAWATSASAIVARDRTSTAALAQAYLRAFRAAEGAGADFMPALVDGLDRKVLAASLHATTVGSVKANMTRGLTLDDAARTAFVSSSGVATRWVLDGGRDTVLEAVRTDTKARGWQRVLGGHACEFCQMLAGRGAVYSASTAGFESHDHCACSAEPAY